MYTDAAIFIAGDLNSRIKDLCDFIPNYCVNYIFNGNIEFPSDSFDMSRTSKDRVCNNFGLSLIDLCCTFNTHVFNGRLFNDKNGEYTCFANNGASVVNYMLASSSIFPYVTDFPVDNSMFSVHCPLYCAFSFSRNTTLPILLSLKITRMDVPIIT